MKKCTVILSLILAMLLCFAASAETISMQSSVDMSTELTDCTLRVSFKAEDVTEKEIFALVYDTASYDIADIGMMKEGDVIETVEGDVTVESIEDSEYGLLINGGADEGGVTLVAVGDDNCYYEMDYEMPAMLVVGQAQLMLAENVNINTYKMDEDFSPAGEGYDTETFAAADVAGAVAQLCSVFGDELDPYQTSVVLQNGVVTDITIDYMP